LGSGHQDLRLVIEQWLKPFVELRQAIVRMARCWS
jgi:hypothetical protein